MTGEGPDDEALRHAAARRVAAGSVSPRSTGGERWCAWRPKGCTPRSRDGTDLPDRFPELAELAGPDLLLDGELVVYDFHGRPDFHVLAARASPERGAPA